MNVLSHKAVADLCPLIAFDACGLCDASIDFASPTHFSVLDDSSVYFRHRCQDTSLGKVFVFLSQMKHLLAGMSVVGFVSLTRLHSTSSSSLTSLSLSTFIVLRDHHLYNRDTFLHYSHLFIPYTGRYFFLSFIFFHCTVLFIEFSILLVPSLSVCMPFFIAYTKCVEWR